MTTHSSQMDRGRRLGRPRVPRLSNLFGCEGLTYTQKESVAVGIAGALRISGPQGQDAGKRGGTDV